MTVFDLLFLVLLLAAFSTLLAILTAAIRGRRLHALKILRRLAIAAAAYLAAVIVAGWLTPPRILHVGDPWCFDDWCLTVENATHAPSPPQVTYTVSLRLSSRARRVSQRAAGAWIYLVDGRGHRHAPEPDPSAIPLDVRLGPGESVLTSRVFKVPADSGPMSLVTGHGDLPGGIPLPIIHRGTEVRLP